jgi:glycosyltransferase involved in cell wall biosynthesis
MSDLRRNTDQGRKLSIGIGITSLERDRAGGGGDGLAEYTAHLLKALGGFGDLVIAPYAFVEARANDGCVYGGSFEPQVARALALGASFRSLDNALPQSVRLVHATDHRIPRLKNRPVVATLHDAIALSHLDGLRYRWKGLRAFVFKQTARWAMQIITVSEHSKKEIVKWFGIPEDKITVTPLGVDEKWHAAVLSEDLARVKAKYELPVRFFLFVGTLQPRKNVRRIIDAHKSLPPQLRREVPLIIAGRHGWMCDAEVAELQNCQDGTLRWLQYVPSEDLLPIFKQATALVWPSLNEGFGLPVLEAFAAGLPVVTSNTTSLPEVAGDAALLVDPENTGEIADAMRQMATNDALRSDLRARGQSRAKQFTWDRTARLTIEVYRKAIESFA